MSYISYFWDWISQSVMAALNTFSTLISDLRLLPFWELFLVVFIIANIMVFLIQPLIGGNVGSSDKAKKKKGKEE